MPKSTKQSSMFGKPITDPDLERSVIEAIEILDDESYSEATKARKAAKETIDAAMKDLKIKPGESLVAGDYVIPCVKREGGGFPVAPWKRIGHGPIKRAPSTNGDSE